MKKISIAFVAAMALASFGCKKKGAAEAMGKMNDFRDKMCACKDKGCADKVNDDYTKWMQDMAKNASGEKATATNEEDAKKMADAATKYQECYTKNSGGEGGSGAMGSGAAEPAGGSAAPAGGSAEPAGGSAAPAAGSAEPAGGSAAPAAGSGK